ncbi:unnamed protein product [Laminaria digitata]
MSRGVERRALSCIARFTAALLIDILMVAHSAHCPCDMRHAPRAHLPMRRSKIRRVKWRFVQLMYPRRPPPATDCRLQTAVFSLPLPTLPSLPAPTPAPTTNEPDWCISRYRDLLVHAAIVDAERLVTVRTHTHEYPPHLPPAPPDFALSPPPPTPAPTTNEPKRCSTLIGSDWEVFLQCSGQGLAASRGCRALAVRFLLTQLPKMETAGAMVSHGVRVPAHGKDSSYFRRTMCGPVAEDGLLCRGLLVVAGWQGGKGYWRWLDIHFKLGELILDRKK